MKAQSVSISHKLAVLSRNRVCVIVNVKQKKKNMYYNTTRATQHYYYFYRLIRARRIIFLIHSSKKKFITVYFQRYRTRIMCDNSRISTKLISQMLSRKDKNRAFHTHVKRKLNIARMFYN